MVEISSIVLDDDREYYIVDEVEVDNTTYTLFTDIEKETEIRIRKTVVRDNKEFYCGLDNQEEFKKVIMAFHNKNNS